MDGIKLKLKSGKDVSLNFSDYSYLEYLSNGVTIKLNSKLIDNSNELYTVSSILSDSVILKDSNNISISFPKEDVKNMQLKTNDKITPAKQIEDCKTIIKAVLNLDIHDDMKGKIVDLMIWNYTGAHGKYKLSYISELANADSTLKRNHEHVFRKKKMISKILNEPENYESILDLAIGCIVTEFEHKKLNSIDKEYPDIDGWERYKLAQMKVIDIKNNKTLEWK